MFDSACCAKTYLAIAGRTEGVNMTTSVSVCQDDELVADRARRTVFRWCAADATVAQTEAAAGPAACSAAT